MSERIERCETCRWWDNPRENEHGAGLLTGSCNRFPPLYVGRRKPSDDDEPHDDPDMWAQPPMYQDDWCGEWQPAGDLPRIDINSLGLAAIELNARSKNCLEGAEPPIETIGQLIQTSVSQLQQVRNMGEGTIRHIRQQLAKNGLALRGERVILPVGSNPNRVT